MASLNDRDARHLAELKATTRRVLTEVMAGGSRDVVFLDAPVHRNLGDSVIWAGTLNYLRELGFRVRMTSDAYRFRDSDLHRMPGNSQIVLHGGGNLGDLYSIHEDFRRHIVTTFPNRRIIVMPQSIHFERDSRMADSYRDYRHGSALTILLREGRSLETAHGRMPDLDVVHCPDAALGLDVRAVPHRRGRPIVLARVDGEIADPDRTFARRATDWTGTGLNGQAYGVVSRALGASDRRMERVPQRCRNATADAAYAMMRALNVSAAVRQLGDARWIATNRLHGHILAALMGIPHFVSDNSYGKVSAIFQEYSGEFTTAHWVDSLECGFAAGERLDKESSPAPRETLSSRGFGIINSLRERRSGG